MGELGGQPKIILSTTSDEVLKFVWQLLGRSKFHFGVLVTILDYFWTMSMFKNATQQQIFFWTVPREPGLESPANWGPKKGKKTTTKNIKMTILGSWSGSFFLSCVGKWIGFIWCPGFPKNPRTNLEARGPIWRYLVMKWVSNISKKHANRLPHAM